jgi:hypothetical protein
LASGQGSLRVLLVDGNLNGQHNDRHKAVNPGGRPTASGKHHNWDKLFLRVKPAGQKQAIPLSLTHLCRKLTGDQAALWTVLGIPAKPNAKSGMNPNGVPG